MMMGKKNDASHVLLADILKDQHRSLDEVFWVGF